LSKIFKKPLNKLRTWNGCLFIVENLNNNLGTIIEVWYEKEYGNLKFLQNKKSSTVIDIGANIGAFTIFVLNKYKDSCVYSYEPESVNFNLLKKNVENNNFSSRVSLNAKAVTGEIGEASISIAGESSGLNSIKIIKEGRRSEIVSCVTLEDVFITNKISFCNLLKIDCEGSEYDLLYNTPAKIFEIIEMIILERHQVEGQSYEDLNLYLEDCGFDVVVNSKFPSIVSASKIKKYE